MKKVPLPAGAPVTLPTSSPSLPAPEHSRHRSAPITRQAADGKTPAQAQVFAEAAGHTARAGTSRSDAPIASTSRLALPADPGRETFTRRNETEAIRKQGFGPHTLKKKEADSQGIYQIEDRFFIEHINGYLQHTVYEIAKDLGPIDI